MKTNLLRYIITSVTILLCPVIIFAQVPSLGTATGFALFTKTGAVGNTGISNITGNIGTDNGAITGFGAPTMVNGTIYNANAVTSQCAVDVQAAYDQLYNTAPTSSSHAPAFGGGETLFAGVYAIAGAGSVAGTLTLDAQGNSNAVFIFKFGGAFTTGASTTVVLSNGALACNVFWAAEGAISMAASTTIKGTVIANNGAISMGAGGILEGRMFSTIGAASIYNVMLSIPTCAKPHGIIIIKSGAVLNLGKNATLVTNSDVDNRGVIQNAGSIILNGYSLQLFPGAAGSIPFMNVLEVKNTGTGIALNQGIRIDKELKLTSGNLDLGNYDITIKSIASSTAAVSPIGAGAGVSYGAGKFILERFINVGSGGHGKSWQLLAVPANGQSIKDSWQEGGAANVGYGTQLTNPLGVAAGYDLYSPSTSIKTYVSATNAYDQGPSSTSTLINNPKGYMLFVRGDRTAASGTGSTPTTLRIKGILFTPANPPASINIDAGKYESVGNPYASQIDFTQLVRTGGTDNTFYTWDPSLAGIYGVGGYQTMTATNSWLPVPGGGNYAGVHKNIESGQAFFVHSSSTTGTIGFTENVKTGGSKLLNKISSETGITTRQFIRSTLLNNTGLILDGNAAAFDTSLSNEVNSDDALKILNGSENFGLMRKNIKLAVEGRSLIATTDTLFYFSNNLQQQAYTLLIVPQDIDGSKQAWLIDNYLQQQTQLSLSDSNYIHFNVTADRLSSKADRFMLVFKTQTVLAVSATTLHAERNPDASIYLNWKTTAENNISEYTIERSTNAINFIALATKNALLNNGTEAEYSVIDKMPYTGNTFYRVRIASLNGGIKYSEVVQVGALKMKPGISVYPNPTAGRLLILHFTNQFLGNYKISLVNSAGQHLWNSKILLINASAGQKTVELPKNVAAGNYHVTLLDKEGQSVSIPVILL